MEGKNLVYTELPMDKTRQAPYARWATEEEIKKSLHKINLNEFDTKFGGIPLFADKEAVYVDPTDTHAYIMGATGSKKSRNLVKPAIQTFIKAGESFVATDPKAELYERSHSMLKKEGYEVFVLNLRDFKKSNCWNPLMIPYRLYKGGQKNRAIELVNAMAKCMMHEEVTKEVYWQNNAADLLSGLIFTLFECAEENEINMKSLRALRTQALVTNEKDNPPFIKENFLDHLDKSAFVRPLLSATAEVCDETRSCIVSQFDQSMRPFFCQDELIDMLSFNDFDMAGLGRKKTAVFMIIPDENTIYHRLVSVFVKQCYIELILEAQKSKGRKLPVRVNFMMDEFATLPPIDDFPAMISAARSRNIRFFLIVQSMGQLIRSYGNHAETIKGNCENWVYLHSNDLSLWNELIEMSGKKCNDEPLVTVSLLKTMDKKTGEAFIFHKRLYPFVANLPDIDEYPSASLKKTKISYPENDRVAEEVFDFAAYCFCQNYDGLRQLFTNTGGKRNSNKGNSAFYNAVKKI
jgi:type IV secretion system protein VirD4